MRRRASLGLVGLAMSVLLVTAALAAITSNVDLVLQYDADQPIQTPRILGTGAAPSLEHAAQCVAIETLRTLMASGMTVQQYNDLSEAAWAAIIQESDARARLNVAAPVAGLSTAERDNAANTGGNFFEHSYVTIIGQTAQADRVQFTRTGGV